MLNSTNKLCYKCLLYQITAICNRRNFCSLVEREFRKRAYNPKDQFGTLGRGRTPQVEQLQKEVDNKYMWTSGEDIYEKEAKKVESISRFNNDVFADATQITVPFAVNSAYVKKVQGKKQALEETEKKFGIDKTARLIIECSRPEFNHYEAQRYPKQNIPLVSEYWDKSKYRNEWFVVRRTQKEALSLQHSTPTSWDHFARDLDPQLLQNIRKCGFHVPTSVQKSVLEMFYATPHLFIAAETGSGKTLAYAAPILSKLVEDKKEGIQSKIIILTVSHLLTQQVHAEVTKFSAGLGLDVIEVDKDSQADDMVFDVLVGEPADVSQFLRSIAEPPKIRFIVFDEADMLLNDNYVKVMTDFLSLVPISSSEDEDQARAVFVAATCPDDLQTIAEGVVEADQLFYVRSEFLHKPLPNIEQMFIRIKEMDKVAKLKEILDEDSETSKRKTMVFCKDRRTAIFVHKTLSAAGFATNLLLNYDASVQSKPKAKVLISTDIGSRGLDIADLKHVINYDFPWHMTDYLHRVGRVGRCSGDPKKIVKSRVTSFIRTIQEVQTAKAIETAIRFGKPLQNVDLKSSMKYQKSRKSKKESEKNVLPDKPTLSE